MLFNLTAVIGLFITMFLSRYITRMKNGQKLLRAMTVLLLVLKIIEFAYRNLQGENYYPMEISAITYYMFSIIVLFKIKRLYHIAAFFGIISGIGFFLYYSSLGFLSVFYSNMFRHSIAVLCHGILFVGGFYLLKKNNFTKTNKIEILLTMAMIIAHASIFYTDAIKGTTFVYFLIKPDFLEVSNIFYINHYLKIAYYLLWCNVFIWSVRKFYKINTNFFIENEVIQNTYEKKLISS